MKAPDDSDQGPTLFVVDDNRAVRRSMQSLGESLGLRVETYASGAQFLDAYDPERPGCLVLDVRLRKESGLDLQDELRQRNATLPIIVMTGHGTIPASVRALKGGAIDFLQKPVPPQLLVQRIQEAIETDRKRRQTMASHAAVTRCLARLTPRERQVMKLLVEGKTSRQIAALLKVSVRTVEGHRHMLLFKMEVSSVAQLVRTVMSAGGASSHVVPRA